MMRNTSRQERSARIRAHYDGDPESGRFDAPHGRLEYERSKAILLRHLPGAAADVLDAGGATGAYSFWLAGLGHRVTLFDLSGVHVEEARRRNRQSAAKLSGIRQGDVLELDFPDGSFDVVLNMGPMYHLPPEERLQALRGMRRVLRDGGLLFSSYISRFAALMDGYRKGYVEDPGFLPLAAGDVTAGIHDPADPKYFTLAWMHRPDEVGPELEAAGFRPLEVCAVEGVFWTYPRLADYVEDPAMFSRLLEHAALMEKEPSVMGASAHFLSVAAR